MKVLIIGAGIGGLLLAQQLKKQNIDFMIFEKDGSNKPRPQGYRIGINKEGLHILYQTISKEKIDSILDHKRLSSFRTGNAVDLKEWLTFDVGEGGLVSRWQLRQLLAEQIPVHENKKFIKYEEKGNEIVAFFDDGSEYEGDYLIGADGTFSRVRQQFIPDFPLLDYGIRGFAMDLSIDCLPTSGKLYQLSKNSLLRLLGPDEETKEERLICVINHDIKNDPMEYTEETEQQWKSLLLQKLKTANPELLELLEKTESKDLIRGVAMRPVYSADFQYLKQNPFPISRVTLLGDAAHPMTTHRGLGANTALQDAYLLAQSLSLIREGKVETLFKYQKELSERGAKNVSDSLNASKMLHMPSGSGRIIRNVILRSIGFVLSLFRYFNSLLKNNKVEPK